MRVRQVASQWFNGQAFPLPSDGDCGIDPLNCSRLAPYVPITVHDFGPQTAEEMEASFPRREEDGRADY